MILVIGGAGQGQLAVALRNTGYTEGDVTRTLGADKPVLSGLQEAVRNALLEGKTQEQILAELLWHEVVVSDEVGCGVVPVEPAQRAHREAVGRLCCRLAERAERVERIFCGLPRVLKGEGPWN